MSGIEGDYRVVNYPAQKSMFEKILGSVTTEIKGLNSMNNEVMAPYFRQIKSLQEMKGIQARMTEEFIIY